MTQATAGFETGTNGATIATTDAGDATAFNTLVGTPVYDNTHAHAGVMAGLFSSVNAQQYVQWSAATMGTLTEAYGRVYLWLDTTVTPSNNAIIQGFDTTPVQAFAIEPKKTAGIVEYKLLIQDTSANTATGTVAMSLNAWVRIEYHVVANATTGSIEARLYNTPDSTTASDTVTLTNVNTKANLGQIRHGITVTNAGTWKAWFDDIVAGATAYPGPRSFTNAYLATDAADAAVTAGTDTKKKALSTLPPGSSTLANVNAVTGATAGVQFTDSTTAGTNGTAMSWYTEPLTAVTIAGQITWTMFGRESATTTNAAPAMKIERCIGDGTVQSTIVAVSPSQGALEYATTAGGATKTGTITAANVTDTTLSNGDRLRLTMWIDDAADQGGSGTMASGGNTQIWYGAKTSGAAGFASITFTEALTPYVAVGVDLSVTGLLSTASLPIMPTVGVGLAGTLEAGATSNLGTVGVGLAGVLEAGSTARLTLVGVGISGTLETGSTSFATASRDATVTGLALSGELSQLGAVGVGISGVLEAGARTALSTVGVGLAGLLAAGATGQVSQVGVGLAGLLEAGTTGQVSSVGVGLTALLAASAFGSADVSRNATITALVPVGELASLGSVGVGLLAGLLEAGATSRLSTVGVGLAGLLAAGSAQRAPASSSISVSTALLVAELPSALATSAITVTGRVLIASWPSAEVSGAGDVFVTGRLWAGVLPRALATSNLAVTGTELAGTGAAATVTLDGLAPGAAMVGPFARASVSQDATATALAAAGAVARAMTTANVTVSTGLDAGTWPVATARADLAVLGALLSGSRSSATVSLTATSSGLLVVGAGAEAGDVTAEQILIVTGLLTIGAWLRGTLLSDHGHATGSTVSHRDRTTLASHERTTVGTNPRS